MNSVHLLKSCHNNQSDKSPSSPNQHLHHTFRCCSLFSATSNYNSKEQEFVVKPCRRLKCNTQQLCFNTNSQHRPLWSLMHVHWPSSCLKTKTPVATTEILDQ